MTRPEDVLRGALHRARQLEAGGAVPFPLQPLHRALQHRGPRIADPVDAMAHAHDATARQQLAPPATPPPPPDGRWRRACPGPAPGAPPCSGPFSAPMAPTTAETASDPVEAMTRAVKVEAFIPWSLTVTRYVSTPVARWVVAFPRSIRTRFFGVSRLGLRAERREALSPSPPRGGEHRGRGRQAQCHVPGAPLGRELREASAERVHAVGGEQRPPQRLQLLEGPDPLPAQGPPELGGRGGPGDRGPELAAELLEGPLPAEGLDIVPGDDQPAALAVHLAERRVGDHHPVEPRCHRLRHACTSGWNCPSVGLTSDPSGFNNPHEALVDAREAARILGVKVATLYSYASRLRVRSFPSGLHREKRYLLDDLERLRHQADARLGHEAVAAGALRWGRAGPQLRPDRDPT